MKHFGMLGRSLAGALLVVPITILGCSKEPRTEPKVDVVRSALTSTFRVGESGYSAVDDLSISNQNGGNGVTDRTATQLLSWKKTGTDAYEVVSFVRFNNLSLPAGSQVTSAQLTLTFENWWTGFTLRGYYLKNAWNAAPAAPLGWLNRDTGLTWNTPGAKGAGTDIHAGLSFSNSTWTGNGDEVRTFALDPAIVQSWIDTPSQNQGVVLVNNESDDKYLRIYSSEDATINRRPLLSITYSAGSSCDSTGVGVWKNAAFSSGSSPFTVNFDAKPSAAPTDAVAGLSLNSASAFTALATIVRFNPSGVIDARNGGSYAATTSVPYTANSSYHFRLVVDVSTHLYSIYVTPPGGSEQTIGTNFAFRTEQASVASLNNWAMIVDADGQGTIDVCNFSATGGGGDPPPPSGDHPRIFLDSTALASLRAKAQAGAPAWNSLKAACTSLIGGVTNSVCTPPTGACDPYPNPPNVGEGYQGDGYLLALMNLAVCYQVGIGLSPPDSNADAWGARGANILSKMTEFTNYSRDVGYGIRNFGVGMALGFDFLYPKLVPSVKSQVVTSLNAWIDFDQSGLTRVQPHANYFAGYYAAKAYAALATEGDNSSATGMWNDFLERLQRGNAVTPPLGGPPHGGVAAYYTTNLTGGGWYEGWQYGNLAVQNMSLPSLAARTAKNIDLIMDSAHPYHYPLDSASHLLHFSWPSRDYLDDRDTLHGGGPCRSNARPASQLVSVAASMLSKWNDPLAPKFHKFARDVRNAAGANAASLWAEFLFWDDTAPEQAYDTLAKSYRATNYAAMRSTWLTDATWASFRASGYVVAMDSTEQFPDPGALVIARGGTPFLVNPGFLDSCYGTTSTEFGDDIHDEIYGTTVCDPTCHNVQPQEIFNTFYNGTPPILGFVPVDGSPVPQTRISQFEDRNGYVLVRGQDLEDIFRTAGNVTSWSRDVVFFRPSIFVVYDRTTVGNTSGDQHVNWHFPPLPVLAAPPSAGAKRYDVTDAVGGFKGAITTLLPANALLSIENALTSDKMYRIEVRPPTPATTLRWLTVLDASTTTGGVALGTALTPSASVNGALLTSSAGNFVALFSSGAAGGPISGSISFTEPAAATKLVVTDLPANTAYAVSVQLNGGSHSVMVQPGAGFTTSSTGTLYVSISAGGTPAAGN